MSHKGCSHCEGMRKKKRSAAVVLLGQQSLHICLKIQQVQLKNLKIKSLFKLVKCCREALGGRMNVWNFPSIFVASSEFRAGM